MSQKKPLPYWIAIAGFAFAAQLCFVVGWFTLHDTPYALMATGEISSGLSLVFITAYFIRHLLKNV